MTEHPSSRISATGTELSVEQRLLECEEALRCAEAEASKWRKMLTEPPDAREGRSVESLSWDELLGVANRNLTAALDADQRLRAIEIVARHVVDSKAFYDSTLGPHRRDSLLLLLGSIDALKADLERARS